MPQSVHRTLRRVSRILKGEYGTPDLGNLPDPLDELIFICLTQRTHESGFTRAYTMLRRQYPTWDKVARAQEASVARAISVGGLVGIKAKRIKRILRDVKKEVGDYDLSFLHDLDDSAAFEFLTKRLGAGTKTAYCVMMYSLERDVFPVDANCLRILQRLEIVPLGVRSTRAHKLLDGQVPRGIAFDLHVNMVVHGRAVCGRKPRCGECVLTRLCPFPTRQ